MGKISVCLILTPLLIVALHGAALAQVSPAFSSVSSPGGFVLMSPGGVAAGLTAATAITVTVRDFTNTAITGLPHGDFEIDGTVLPYMADGSVGFPPTIWDVSPAGFAEILPGVYQIAGPLFSGGNSLSGFIVRVQGVPILFGTPTSHRAVSPDFTRDGAVNLPDLGFFASCYFGTCLPVCDLNGDGACNLIDLAIFALHYGESYPPGYALDVD